MRKRTVLILLILLTCGLTASSCAGGGHGTVSAHPSRFEIARARLIASLRPASAVTLPPLPADCVPSSTGPQPQIGVYVTLSGTATINSPYGPVANTTLSGWICGIATVINRPPNLCTSPPGQYASVQLHIPADGLNITIPVVNVTLIPRLSIPITHITVVPTAINAIVCGVAAPGPIRQTITTTLPVAANTFGASCVLPVTVPVTAEIYGPLSGFTISAYNDPFAIPPLQASPTCTSNLTAVANKLLALPLPQPANEIHISGSGLAYQP